MIAVKTSTRSELAAPLHPGSPSGCAEAAPGSVARIHYLPFAIGPAIISPTMRAASRMITLGRMKSRSKKTDAREHSSVSHRFLVQMISSSGVFAATRIEGIGECKFGGS